MKSLPEPSPAWVMSTGLESPVITGSALMVTAPHEAAPNKNSSPKSKAVNIADLNILWPNNRIDKAPTFISLPTESLGKLNKR
jgi:hypothetical protein